MLDSRRDVFFRLETVRFYTFSSRLVSLLELSEGDFNQTAGYADLGAERPRLAASSMLIV